jgi:hypothetical protein
MAASQVEVPATLAFQVVVVVQALASRAVVRRAVVAFPAAVRRVVVASRAAVRQAVADSQAAVALHQGRARHPVVALELRRGSADSDRLTYSLTRAHALVELALDLVEPVDVQRERVLKLALLGTRSLGLEVLDS